MTEQCSNCGRVVGNPGAFARHSQSCGRIWTVEALLLEGHVDVSVGSNACWIWARPIKFAKKPSNYPYFDGRPAHRRMWIAAHGDIPTSVVVCHRCDNPWCVNVRHLWIGTQAENLKDMHSKGRHWRQKAREQVALV